MLYVDEIKEQLKDVPRDLCVAFATRAALRVLPLLASNDKKNKPFWYWTKSQNKHLLAIFTASHFGLAFSFGAKNISAFDTFFDAISAADNAADAAADAFSAHTSTAVEAIYSARAATAAVAAYSAAATAADAAANADAPDDAYAYLANISKLFKDEIKSDLHLLKGNPDIQLFLQQPLWKQSFPNELTSIFQRFQQWTNTLDAGFDFWLDWYQQRLDGKPLDAILLEKQVNISDEIKRQGVKPVNAYLAALT